MYVSCMMWQNAMIAKHTAKATAAMKETKLQ
jgi:hypothetical protein